MGYLFLSKINLTVCLVHINSDKIANRQENPIIYLMSVVLWVNIDYLHYMFGKLSVNVQ